MKHKLGLSIDMDNQWSYMKTHGDSGWDKYPTYFNVVIPKVLGLVKELDIPITFFLVGKDLEKDGNTKEVEKIAKAGLSIANHSYNHEPWLHKYNYEQINKEIELTDSLLQSITGQKPIGFRGPGFIYSNELFKVLIANGYKYDASTLPTFIGPLARWYYFKTAELSQEERDKRRYLFGKISEGFRRNKPHYLAVSKDTRIAELPVTTFPIIRSPIHLSYLVYLYRFDIKLLNAYLYTAVLSLKFFNVPVSFLLHPLDFVGGDSIKSLAFFPGMDLKTDEKLDIVRHVLGFLKQRFNILDMNDYYNNCFTKD